MDPKAISPCINLTIHKARTCAHKCSPLIVMEQLGSCEVLEYDVYGKFKFAHKFPRTHGEDSEYHAVDEWIRAYKPNPDDEELTIPIQRPFWR